jgi:hypothetical protein
MFTHLNVQTAPAFTNGEKVTGGTSGAIGYVQSISTTRNTAVTSISVASPGVVTLSNHGFKEGQQITLTGGTWQVNSASAASATVYTVKNPTTNTFQLFNAAGDTAINVTSFSSAPTVTHGVICIRRNNYRRYFISYGSYTIRQIWI